jgi:tight adherence protein B
VTSWPCAVAAGIVAATAVRLLRRARAAAWKHHALAGAATVLRALVRDLQAGVDPTQAVRHAARDAAAPVAAMLAELPGADPLSDATPRAEQPDAVLVGVAARLRAGWKLSAAHGIPLAEVIAALAADLADRTQGVEARAAQVAGPAVSGYVLAALPAAGLLLGAGMGTDPLDVLTGSAIGGALLVVGTALCCGGLLWADRIVRG